MNRTFPIKEVNIAYFIAFLSTLHAPDTLMSNNRSTISSIVGTHKHHIVLSLYIRSLLHLYNSWTTLFFVCLTPVVS